MRELWTSGELKPAQVGAARYLLGWSQTDLARAANVSRWTVTHFENATRPPHRSVREALRLALEAAGIEFLYAKDGSYGVIITDATVTRAEAASRK